jgi:hypothetical protein
MSDQFWLTKAQLKRLELFFPRTRGIPRVGPDPRARGRSADAFLAAMPCPEGRLDRPLTR